MFDYANNIKRLQIEITNLCNAYCPGCARNDFGGKLKDHIYTNAMQSVVWQRLITIDNLENIIGITLNGAFGDPLMHPDILEMLDHLYTVKPDVSVTISTNGSMRNEKFFYQLAEVLRKFRRHEVIFSIDGLEDTNQIYRRNTNFNKIIKNLKAFNTAGGRAEWWMVVFEHNKHQIVRAKQMAKDLGCHRFALRKSYEKEIEAKSYLKFPAGVMVSPDYSEVERLISLHNTEFVRDDALVGEVNEMSSAHTKDKMLTRKVCPWAEQQMIQIDHLGHIWPCCYVHEFQLDGTKPEWDRKYLSAKHGTFYNNIMVQKNLKSILESPFFAKYVNESWEGVGKWKDKSPLCKKCLGQ